MGISAKTNFKYTPKQLTKFRPRKKTFPMPDIFKCQFCAARLPTSQGLRSHMTQSRSCHEKLEATYRQDHPHIETPDDMTGEMPPADSPDELEDEGAGDPQYDPPFRHPSPPNAEADAMSGSEQPLPKRVRIEEVEDEGAPGRHQWIEDFPSAAGANLGSCQTKFEQLREKQGENGDAPWAPFESEEEWELARWLMTSGVSQKKTDTFLKLKTVRTWTWHVRHTVAYDI